MSMESSSANNGSVTVFIYEQELDFLKWLVLQKREIETGGDLFGLWQDERTAVVQLILGPGEKCRRTTTSFHQDVKYLRNVGAFLTSSQGLCNIGEWHSHHTLGLAEPSHGDQQTVWNNISAMAGGRFLVFIANIRGTPPVANIGCFLFNWSHKKMLRGTIKCLTCPSPVRMTVDTTCITSKAERGQDWITFMKNDKPVVEKSTPKDSSGGSKKSKQQNRNRRKAGKDPASKENIVPSITITPLSNSPKVGDGISSTTTSTRSGSLGSEDDELNAENSKAGMKDSNGNATSTRSMESHTSKDGNGISSMPSTPHNNQNAASNLKKRMSSKKGKQGKKQNTTSKAQKKKSNKKSKRARQRTKRDEEEMNEDDYGDEDALLPVDESEEQKLGTCGRVCKRLRQICSTVMNFFRQRIYGRM